MNSLAQPSIKKADEIARVVNDVFADLELTETQRNLARERYEAVGNWIAGSSDPFLQTSYMYAQGSLALDTSVKPIGRDEFDVDLVVHIPNGRGLTTAELKSKVGDRLKEHGRYRAILKEKNRCWRLDYAGDFHLDITPSVPNLACSNGGELVPDRALKCWKPSNPRGYLRWFREISRQTPGRNLRKVASSQEPFPAHNQEPAWLPRIVQLIKRHRDVYFLSRNDGAFAPISIILTTLAGRSYLSNLYRDHIDSPWSLIIEVTSDLPRMLESEILAGRRLTVVSNPTTAGENFADKWALDQSYEMAFFEWHSQLVRDLEALSNAEGIDGVFSSLRSSFGEDAAIAATGKSLSEISDNRERSRLAVTSSGSLAATGRGMRSNTFFGS